MIRVNGESYDFVGITLEEVLKKLAMSTRGVAVARNGEIVPRAEWTSTIMYENDLVEIVTAAAGG
jgi:sulfur carrier protein